MHRFFSVAPFALVCTWSLPAFADEPSPTPTADSLPESFDAKWAGVERAWLYTPDPSAPPPLRAIASLGVGVAAVDRGAARPFAADTAHEGAVMDADAELGLLKWASLEGQFLMADRDDEGQSAVAPGGLAFLNFRPLPERFPIALVLSGGYLRELGGANGVFGRATVASVFGRFRVGSSVLIEHVGATPEAPKRDPADVMITAAASATLVSWAELGVENVVQDLEEIAEGSHGDDGGTKDFIGPTATLVLAKRVRITGGPAVGLGSAPRALGRVQATYFF